MPAKDRLEYVLPVPIGTPRMAGTPVLVLGVLVLPRIVVVRLPFVRLPFFALKFFVFFEFLFVGLAVDGIAHGRTFPRQHDELPEAQVVVVRPPPPHRPVQSCDAPLL